MSNANPLPIAVLISGGGTTLRNILRKIENRELNAQVRLVISSRADAGGLTYAREADIPYQVVPREGSDSDTAFSEAVFGPCRDAAVGLVVMGGFLKFVPIPPDFEGRVMNIHPSLIPAFSGAGFYGPRVHRAVLEYGAKISGCTVHFVDNQYDHGPIILQRAVEVRDDDTAESLAARIFQEECQALPDAIQRFAEGRLSLVGRHVRTRSGQST